MMASTVSLRHLELR